MSGPSAISSVSSGSSAVLPTFNDLPNENFLQATTVGQSAREGIQTLSTLRCVSEDLKQKVDGCWGSFAQQCGNKPLLLPSSTTITPENAYEVIKTQYPILKRWADTDPEVTENFITEWGSGRQCVVKNDQGTPGCWYMIS